MSDEITEVIAILYNDESKIEECIARYVWEDYEYNKKLQQVKFKETLLIFCKSDYHSVMSRFCAEHISHFTVADDSFYSGKSLQYLTSRIRPVK